MRKFLIISLIFIHKIALCQLNDNFDDGDFTTNPVWLSPTTPNHFTIENGMLRSNSTTANSNFFLVTANKLALNSIWEFDCNLKFATSGSNYADIYLISDNEDLNNSNLVNGYFVRIGNTDDEISLFKRTGNLSSATKIIDGQNGIVSSTKNNPFKIRVTRSDSGEFTLEWDKSQTGNQFQLEGKAVDNEFTNTNWFGVYVQQSTSSFHQKHFFDNFLIKEIEIDTEAPEILSIKADKNKLTIIFNENIDLNEVDLSGNFLLDPQHSQIINKVIDSNSITLAYETEFETGDYTFTILKIKDVFGNLNTTPLSISFSYTKPYTAKPNDIVINEIFADPSPQIDLPTSEFTELYNTTSERIALKGFKYSDATSTYTFGDEYISPHEFLILCSRNDTTEYKKYGRVIGISPWPSLNNDKDVLTLKNNEDAIIHQVYYNDSWYRDAVKKNGGYSLELIDPTSSCIQSQNFIASVDPSGGTPGKQNSVFEINKSTIPLSILNVTVKNETTISLTFSGLVDSLQASVATIYSLNNNIGRPNSVKVLNPNFDTVELYFDTPLKSGINYSLLISEISDCGNTILKDQRFSFMIAPKPEKGKILINEILFNPRPNGHDFVEIYNHSNETFDFKDFFIATTNAQDSVINIKTITQNSILFKPNTYWVITTNPENIQSEYFTPNTANFIKVPSLPAFNNDKGVVVLLDTENQRIDQLNYDKKMHFPLLKDDKGVSLERSFFDEPTNKSGNFRSATANVGYATPAYKNSQSTAQTVPLQDGISLSTKVLSPDNDGANDILSINYQIDQTNYVANVNIYNDEGRLIRKLVKNESISLSGTWLWDGFDLSQNRVKTGIYILHTELFDLSGKRKNYKTAFSVVSRQ